MAVTPFNRFVWWWHHLIDLFGGATIWVTNLFGGDANWVTDLFGGATIWETSSTRKPNFVAVFGVQNDSNENFSCHSVISRFKCTKYQFLSDQCRVPLISLQQFEQKFILKFNAFSITSSCLISLELSTFSHWNDGILASMQSPGICWLCYPYMRKHTLLVNGDGVAWLSHSNIRVKFCQI